MLNSCVNNDAGCVKSQEGEEAERVDQNLTRKAQCPEHNKISIPLPFLRHDWL